LLRKNYSSEKNLQNIKRYIKTAKENYFFPTRSFEEIKNTGDN